MNKRLLWIEDDASALGALVSGLRKDGWEIVTATSEEEAYQRLAKDDKWDAILLDIILPERENPTEQSLYLPARRQLIGLDVLTHINEHYSERRPPVIVLTKVANDAVHERLAELDVTQILVKGSLTPQKVTEAVHKAIGSGGSEPK